MAGTAELLISVRADAGPAITVLQELQQQTRLLEQVMVNTASSGIKQATEATTEATSVFGKFNEQLTRIGEFAIGSAIGNLGATLGMDLAEHVKNAAEAIDTFGQATLKVQTVTGTTAEQASTLVAVFERYGMTGDDTASKLSRFERALTGADTALDLSTSGGKRGQQVLQELGVQYEDTAGKVLPMDQVLANLADRWTQVDAASRNAATRSLFGGLGGSGAEQMNLMLSQGKAGFEQLEQAVQKYGLTLNQENVDDVKAFVMAHRDMDLALQGVAVQLGAAFMPAITSAAEAVSSMAEITATDVTPVLKSLGDLHLDWLGPATVGLVGFGAAVKIVSTLLTPVAGMMESIASAASGIEVGFAAAAGTISVLGAAIYTFSEPLRDAIDTLYKLRDAVNALPSDQMNPVQKWIADRLNQLPNLSSPGSAGSATAEVSSAAEASTGEPSVSPAIKTATEAADNAKINLQQIDDAAAQRKTDFDNAHVANETTALQLKIQQTEAEQQLLVYKQQIEDIDRQAIDYAQQRKDLDDQDAATRAKMAEAPLTAANADIKYQEDLLKAQVAAARAGGSQVDMSAARAKLDELEKQSVLLQPQLITAQHNADVASRATTADSEQKSLRDNAVTRAKIDVEQQMQPLQDEVTARTRIATAAQAALDLDKQRFDLAEKAYQVQEATAKLIEEQTAHELAVLKNPPSTNYGPNPVASAFETTAPASAAPTSEQPGQTALQSPSQWNEQPGQTYAQSHNVTVNVDVTHNADEGSLLDKVIAVLQASWQQAMASEPQGRSLGGSILVPNR